MGERPEKRLGMRWGSHVKDTVEEFQTPSSAAPLSPVFFGWVLYEAFAS